MSHGDFSSDLEAVEGGEIGLLQARFNHMVTGLREQERMREVFGRRVGPEVAHRALEGDFQTAGQICRVTIMFVDIVSSTEMTQREDPNAVVAILNGFFDRVVRVVGAEGGLVNKFLGDGALCVFGAPEPAADHAERGLRAARLLTDGLVVEGLHAVIGVATGDVVAGNIGASDRYEYTVIGPAVNEASRLCEAAKSSSRVTLASERCVRYGGVEAASWIKGNAYSLRGLATPTVSYSPPPSTGRRRTARRSRSSTTNVRSRRRSYVKGSRLRHS